MNHPTATHWTYVRTSAGRRTGPNGPCSTSKGENMREIYPKREHAKADIIHD